MTELARTPSKSSPAKNRDSVSHTLFMAVAISLICSVLVSTTVILLKPLQKENQLYHSGHKNILQLLQSLPQTEDSSELAAQLRMKLVDLENGDYISTIEVTDFDSTSAAKDAELGVDIPQQLDVAGIGRRSRYAVVHLVEDNSGIRYIILPIYGQGMWSSIHGYLALQADANTIAGLIFYEHGETPGIGDRIQDTAWLQQWQGKQIYMDGKVQISIVKRRQAGLEAFQVDAISGATLTGDGVGNMMQYWLGTHGFETYLERIRSVK